MKQPTYPPDAPPERPRPRPKPIPAMEKTPLYTAGHATLDGARVVAAVVLANLIDFDKAELDGIRAVAYALARECNVIVEAIDKESGGGRTR